MDRALACSVCQNYVLVANLGQSPRRGLLFARIMSGAFTHAADVPPRWPHILLIAMPFWEMVHYLLFYVGRAAH